MNLFFRTSSLFILLTLCTNLTLANADGENGGVVAELNGNDQPAAQDPMSKILLQYQKQCGSINSAAYIIPQGLNMYETWKQNRNAYQVRQQENKRLKNYFFKTLKKNSSKKSILPDWKFTPPQYFLRQLKILEQLIPEPYVWHDRLDVLKKEIEASLKEIYRAQARMEAKKFQKKVMGERWVGIEGLPGQYSSVIKIKDLLNEPGRATYDFPLESWTQGLPHYQKKIRTLQKKVPNMPPSNLKDLREQTSKKTSSKKFINKKNEHVPFLKTFWHWCNGPLRFVTAGTAGWFSGFVGSFISRGTTDENKSLKKILLRGMWGIKSGIEKAFFDQPEQKKYNIQHVITAAAAACKTKLPGSPTRFSAKESFIRTLAGTIFIEKTNNFCIPLAINFIKGLSPVLCRIHDNQKMLETLEKNAAAQIIKNLEQSKTALEKLLEEVKFWTQDN